MRYPVESFTPAEQDLLTPHFTNLDKPVFALTNLPETAKGALFSRYSRYGGTLRRLYLDEFASDATGSSRPFDGEEGKRAAKLYESVFLGYGDDSIAQLGGAHIATEWVSNILTKVLQRGRLAAYLEQSTRYIAYDQEMPGGGYRYFRCRWSTRCTAGARLSPRPEWRWLIAATRRRRQRKRDAHSSQSSVPSLPRRCKRN